MADTTGIMETEQPGIFKRIALYAVRAAADEAESLAAALQKGGQGIFRWSVAFVKRQYWAWAIAGSLVLGLTLPVLLVIWSMGGGLNGGMAPPVQPGQSKVVAGLTDSLLLLYIALVFCGPLAILFALGVYGSLRQRADRADAVLGDVAKRGAITAGLIAFLNVPGYMAGILLQQNGLIVWVQLPLLFIVAGASCGFWIAWQAWRATRPKESLLPRYSLGWLFALMIAWGVLLAIFAPAAK